MTFLPIVERELRSASRRRSTFRVRWWTATAAMVVGLFALTLVRPGGNAGRSLFEALSLYAFVLCLLFGVLLTAEALAQERREGTLGLLFLTDLRGYDVVLGKFFAHSLNTLYALFALLPALALPLLLGGVKGAEFWRMALALLNAIFISLAAGLFVSALSRDTRNAISNAFGLMVCLAVVLPMIAVGLRWARVATAWQAVGWLSPWFAFTHSSDLSYARGQSSFWSALGATHALGWGFLGLASFILPRTLQDNPVPSRLLPKPARPVPRSMRARRNKLLLGKDPVAWLRSIDLPTPRIAWLIVLAWGLVSVTLSFLGGGEGAFLQVESGRPFALGVKLLLALEACRFFVEARRNGTLELLLSTPLSNKQIVRGQMSAVFRNFGPPLLGIICLLFLPIVWKMWHALFGAGASHSLNDVLGTAFLAGIFTLRTAADVFAILWVGTALALTGKRPALAPAFTIFWVLIVPAPVSFCWVDILVDLVLISWATGKCRIDLRRLVSGGYYSVPLETSSVR